MRASKLPRKTRNTRAINKKHQRGHPFTSAWRPLQDAYCKDF